MVTRLVICFFGLWQLSSWAAIYPGEVKLFSVVRQSTATNEFWVPLERLKSTISWNPEKEIGPPLSLETALKTAFKYVSGIEKSKIKLQSVELLPFQSGGFRTYYYVIVFRADSFDSVACVVLLDGSVVDSLRPKLRGDWRHRKTLVTEGAAFAARDDLQSGEH